MVEDTQPSDPSPAAMLAAHEYLIEQGGSALCRCGWPESRRDIETDLQTAHRSHLAEVLTQMLAVARAEGIREWIAEWPTTPGDGTFLADVASDGRSRAARITRGGGA